MHDFIHTDWYQRLFSEPAPLRWLWRATNVWVTDEMLASQTPDRANTALANRLLCIFDEQTYRRRKRAMRNKVKYTHEYHNNKKKMRELLLARDGDRCTICLKPLRGDYSLDHIDNTLLPDGSLCNDSENLRLTHARCNSRRSIAQNRKQNRAWKKAAHSIASIHNVDAHTIGMGDRKKARRKAFRNTTRAFTRTPRAR